MTFSLEDKKVGFIGVGHIAQSILSAFVENKILKGKHIFVHNRTPGKARKMVDRFGVTALRTPEQLVENSDIVILATKPQDLLSLLEPLGNVFTEDKVVISLASGVQLSTLKKFVRMGHLVRLMPSTPIFVCQAVIGFCLVESHWGLENLVRKLFSPLGYVVLVEEGEEFSSMTVAASSGTGFVFEIMQYWKDWLQEHGLASETACKIVIQTFMGAALLAQKEPGLSFDELASKVASKKGVTCAGLESMRELELEGILRMSFNRALIRDQEIARENS